MTTDSPTTLTPAALRIADAEVAEYFTAAIGVRAQSYEPAQTVHAGGDADLSLLSRGAMRARARHAAIDRSMRELDRTSRGVLELVYGYGAGALSADAGQCDGLVKGRDGSQDALGLLRVALAPKWGRGSFLRLALLQPRAIEAYAKRHDGKQPSADVLLTFLCAEAGLGQARTGFFVALRNECERPRRRALAAYEGFRLQRVELEKQEARAREADRERAFDAAMGKVHAAQHARLSRRMGSA
jgi:hypothetical protein